MADGKTQNGGHDRNGLHVHWDRELPVWPNRCAVIPLPLKTAVQAAGSGSKRGVTRHRFRLDRWAIALAASLGLVTSSGAQPTENPKGTLPATESSAPKPSAAHAPKAGNSGTDDGNLVGTEAQTRARMQGATPPGGGTAGGLPRKQSSESSGDGAARTDKGSAAPRPLPPSK